jgi:16S rRNA (uracil1498-N3)-methyltransferase
VIEASMQCGRNRLLQIDEPRAWPDFVAAAETPCRLLAHPGGAENAWKAANSVPLLGTSSAGRDALPGHCLFQAVAHCTEKCGPVECGGDVCLAVGPEGGFTDEEIALAVAAGWQTVDLGPRILRVETAALFLAAVVASVQSR